MAENKHVMRSMRVSYGAVTVKPKFNVRGKIDPEDKDFKDFRQNIKEIGMIEDPVVWENPDGSGKFELVSGFRRWLAAGPPPVGLGWDLIDVKVLPAGTTELQAYYVNIAENVQREDLSSYALAERCLMLRTEYKQTGDEIGAAIKKSKSHVNSLIRCMTELHPALKAAWKAADLGSGFGTRGGPKGARSDESAGGFTLDDLFRQSSKDKEEQKEWFENLTRRGGANGEGGEGKGETGQTFRPALTRAKIVELLATLTPVDAKGNYRYDAGNGKEWQAGAIMALRWAAGDKEKHPYVLRRDPFAAAVKAHEEIQAAEQAALEKEAKRLAEEKAKEKAK